MTKAGGVAVEGVTLTLEGRTVLDGVDLALEPGRLTALLGPSGAGKTSLLKVLAGLETPERGRVAAGDSTWSDARSKAFVPAQERGVGLVFQSYAIWPHMTVLQNVAFPLRVRRLAKDEITRRALAALDVVRLGPDVAGRLPAALSGGEQQRVALARALVYEPTVLLLDEPLANLDAPAREGVRAEIRRLQRRTGITTLYVTHDQSEALAIADRLAIMDRGRIVEVGPPRRVYETPSSPFTARFLGARSELRGTVRGGSVGVSSVPIPAPGLEEGTRALVLLRPDDLELLSAAPGPAAAWRGVVAAAEYAGDRARCAVDLEVTGSRLVVDVPAERPPEPGDGVWIALRPGRAKVFRDEPSRLPAAEPVREISRSSAGRLGDLLGGNL